MNRTHKRTWTVLVALLAVTALVVSACGSDEDETINMARADWSSGHMQAAIYAELITELGHTVSDPAASTLNPNSFYPALGTRQYDLWVNGWDPTHQIFFTEERVSGLSEDRNIEWVGAQIGSGALQGYMIDKATADSAGITSMSQLADASVARVFDSDSDGQADLIGCNEGWGCHSIISDHISEFDWGANVEQISGDYNSLIAGVEASVSAGDPVLFYAWTPNWTYERLKPGEDVVWLEAPALEDDEGLSVVQGLQGCAADPCNLGFAVNSIRAVANSDFLDDYPDIRRLLEVVKIPLGDIAAQNVKIADAERGYSDAEIKADALAWIAANRATVDGWLATARG